MAMGLGLDLSLGNGGAGGLQLFADSVSGSDANSGLTSTKPKQTIAALSALVVTGARINLAKGSTWKERLVITANGVSVSAYGSGSAPLFDCSDVVDAGSWTKTAGRTNIYQATLTVQTDANAAEWPALWINGARVTTVAASLAALDSTPGAIYYSGVADQTSITLYVHSTGSTDPRSDGKTYEAAIRASGIDTYNATGCSITGIDSRRQYCSYGGIVLGRYCTANNCVNTDGNIHNFLGRAFSSFNVCTAVDGFADGTTAPIPFVFYEGTPPAGATGRLSSCVADWTTYVASAIGAYAHSGGGGNNWTEIQVVDFVTDNVGIPIACADAALLTVSGGTFTNWLVGVKPGVPATVSGGVWSSAKTGAQMCIFDAQNISVTLDGCNFTINGTGAAQPMTGCSLTVQNCTITGANYLLAATGKSNLTINFNHNTFIPNGRMFGTIYTIPTATGLTFSADYNSYGGTTGDFNIGGVVYANFAAYQAAGYDTHSTNV